MRDRCRISSALALVCVCWAAACSDDDASPKPYATVEIEREITIGVEDVELTLPARNGSRTRLSIPALAVRQPTRVTVRLVSGVRGQGRVPVLPVAVEVDAPGVTFAVPARLGQRLSPPPPSRRYTGVVALPGSATFVPFRTATRVLPLDDRGEEEWEAEANGPGVWGLALEEPGAGADAGASDADGAAPTDYVVEDQAEVQLGAEPVTVTLGAGARRTVVTAPGQPPASRGSVLVVLVSGLTRPGPQPANGSALRVVPRVPIAVPLRVQQTVAQPLATSPALTRARVVAATTRVVAITLPDGATTWRAAGAARVDGLLAELDAAEAGFYAFAFEATDERDGGVAPDAATSQPDAAPAPSSVTLRSTATDVPLGSPLTFTATVVVAGAPATMGVVTFVSSLYGTLGTAPVNPQGVATRSFTCGIDIGAQQITATWQQGSPAALASPPLAMSVSKGNAGLTLNSFNNMASDYWRGLGFGFTGCPGTFGGGPLTDTTLSIFDEGALVLQFQGNIGNVVVNAPVPFGKNVFRFSAQYGGNTRLLPVTVTRDWTF